MVNFFNFSIVKFILRSLLHLQMLTSVDEIVIYIEFHFHTAYQRDTWLAGNVRATHHSLNVVASCYKAFVVVRTYPDGSEQHLEINAARIGGHTYIISIKF